MFYRILFLCGGLLSMSFVASAQTLQSTLPDETVQEARASEATLTFEQRTELQVALQWFRYYTSTIDGAFGRGTRNAMANWQADNGFEPTGILTTAQRSILISSYVDALSLLGLAELRDATIGLSLLLPLNLVEFARYDPPFIVYEPKGGSGIRLILISQQGDRGQLAALYEVLQTLEEIPLDGPRGRTRDGFTIRGESATRIAEVRVNRTGEDHIYGFILSWPPERTGLVNEFLGLLEDSIASIGLPAPEFNLVDPASQRPALFAGFDIRQPLYGRSGVYIDTSGRVLTSAEVAQGCASLTVDRAHAMQVAAVDESLGVALLTPAEPLIPMASAQFGRDELRLGERISVAGFPYEGILGAASLTFGNVADRVGLTGLDSQYRLDLINEVGDYGGPLFDNTGAVVGLVVPHSDQEGRILPAQTTLATKSANLQAFLSAQNISTAFQTTAEPITPREIAANAADMTVLVQCWPS